MLSVAILIVYPLRLHSTSAFPHYNHGTLGVCSIGQMRVAASTEVAGFLRIDGTQNPISLLPRTVDYLSSHQYRAVLALTQ